MADPFNKTGPLATLRDILTRHVGMNFTIQGNPSGIAWAVPLAVTEFLGTNRMRRAADLSTCKQARLSARVVTPAAAGAVLAVQYSLDQTTWTYLDGTSGPTAAAGATATLPALGAGWVNIDPPAKADVYLRVVGSGGDGSTSGNFGAIDIQVR